MRVLAGARALAAASWLAAATVGPAYGHAVLLDSRPGDGESVATPPTAVELEFNEPVVPVTVHLLDRQGHEIPDVTVQAQGNTVVVRPRAPLPPGGYFISYRVTSIDAHAVGATLRFGVGEPAPGAGAEVASAAVGGYLGVLARWLFYATALGAAGMALFVSFVGPPPLVARWVRRLAVELAAVAVAAVVLRLGVAGLDLGGLPLAALLTSGPWTIAASTSLGIASALATVGLMILALARKSDRLLPAGALLIAVSFAFTGHAASVSPRWLTGPAVGLHVLCAAFWLGAFVPLLCSLGAERGHLTLVLRRFSVRAMVAVGALILTGGALAWIQLGGSLSAATSTAYGWRLLLKLALVALLLGLALVNRLVLTPAVATGTGRAVVGLRRTLIADIALALAILAVTATFPLSPPPRSATAAEEGVSVVASGRGGQATITLLPGRVGANRIEATVVDRDGLPIVARSAELIWSMPAGGFEPLHLPATLPLPGVVIGGLVTMPKPGRWRLRLDLLVDDFTKFTFEGEIDLR